MGAHVVLAGINRHTVLSSIDRSLQKKQVNCDCLGTYQGAESAFNFSKHFDLKRET